jgi:aspartate/methionine/tyrosine aminotransferase
MPLPVFRLEEFLGEWEFKAPYLLCCSDAETWSQEEILSFADDETTSLWKNLKLSYTEVSGLSILREEIATLYPRCQADNILCFAGAEEGILCASQALLTPADHAIVITPCYQSLEELPRHTGASVTTIELAEQDRWELDLNRVKAAIRSNTKMLFINYPHNPTGMRLERSKLDELVALARHHGIIIFADEVYRLLGAVEGEHEPPIAELYERGISLGVMSKAFGLAGLRVGWIATQSKEMLKKMEQVKHYASICNSAPSEVLSLIALRSRVSLLARNNKIVRDNMAILDEFFKNQQAKFSWVRPTGGCVGFVRYHGSDGVDRFCEELVAAEGVLLLPGRVYNDSQQHFRIGFGRKNMPDALTRLQKFVQKSWSDMP